ncbi:MAG TPA: hypothetical protein VGA80_18030 [Flavobacteriaceae bacterium]
MKNHILKTALIAGTLDISAAFIKSYFVNDVLPSRVLQYIASGIFGSDAFSGGFGIMAIGLLVHYVIAFSCTTCFFWLYPKWGVFKKSMVLNSILIALVAWIVTTRIIVPLSKIKPGQFDISNALVAVAILIVCIGFPIAFSAKRHFGQKEQ